MVCGSAPVTSPNDVLDFWFPPATRPDSRQPDGRDDPRWFQADAGFDAAIRDRFGGAVGQAASGALDRWADTPDGALALIVLLDQFPRNIFRGDRRAFDNDAHARRLADAALSRGFDQALPKVMRKFFYLPFEHAEDLASQDRSVALFTALGDPETLRYAERHRDIVRRFGRFPHRNALLGRPSTAEETAWLDAGGDTFGTSV
ncbi:MAG: DUF924 family protein [Alphaproteobacteria bacterium]|nr:DUF924 family protein [Alphaproteobacteria bacterium]